MNFDQWAAIEMACLNNNMELVMELVRRGNNVGDGGWQLHPDKYYFISSYGRMVQVENGSIKLIGSIRSGQYIRVELLCTNEVHGEKSIPFPLADLVDKEFNKSVDGSKYVADHKNFRRRDNHYKNLRRNSWKGNSSRKRKGTYLVRNLFLYLKMIKHS